jgi:RNA polymerase sigma factor (sigma-70 family)
MQSPADSAFFHTTRWSMVLSAAEEQPDALEKLCRSYWRPLYSFARRDGRTQADAEDVVQGFLARLLEKHWLQRADRERGRFRTFLQMMFKCYLIDQYDFHNAKKRGGGVRHVSLDVEGAEAEYVRQLSETDSPSAAFDRAWAMSVFDDARTRLRRECEQAGRVEAFDLIQAGVPYEEVARECALTREGVRSLAFRLRKRLQELLRLVIRETVTSPDDLEDEVQALKGILMK